MGNFIRAQILFEAQLFLKLLLQLLSTNFFTTDGKGNLTAVWLAGHEIKSVLHKIKRLFTTEFLIRELRIIKIGHKMLSFTIEVRFFTSNSLLKGL